MSKIAGVMALSVTLVLACQPAIPADAHLAPYRAIYKMVLESTKSSSVVVDAQGRMMYEFRDVCDGWITEQRFQMNFLYAESEPLDTTTNFNSWESKDGLSYRFNVQKTSNGQIEEVIRGSAAMKKGGKGGTATFTEPEKKTIPLDAGTLLPTEHTIRLIDVAKTGQNIFNAVVFDGSDVDGGMEINAVISPPQVQKKLEDLPDPAQSPIIAEKTYRPVRFAFFPVDNTEALPEYESDSDVYDNGFWDNMVFDYGTFKVRAILEKVEEIPAPKCS